MSGHGGKRPGSGRPRKEPEEKFLIQSYSLDQNTIHWIQLEARDRGISQSKLARQLLHRALNALNDERAERHASTSRENREAVPTSTDYKG